MVKSPQLKVSARTIDSFRKYKASRLVRDLTSLTGKGEAEIAKLLLAGGVPAAFLIRKRIFALNSALKELQGAMCKAIETKKIKRVKGSKYPKHVKEYFKWLGYMEALEDTRRSLENVTRVRGIATPENDPKFAKMLWVSRSQLNKG